MYSEKKCAVFSFCRLYYSLLYCISLFTLLCVCSRITRVFALVMEGGIMGISTVKLYNIMDEKLSNTKFCDIYIICRFVERLTQITEQVVKMA